MPRGLATLKARELASRSFDAWISVGRIKPTTGVCGRSLVLGQAEVVQSRLDPTAECIAFKARMAWSLKATDPAAPCGVMAVAGRPRRCVAWALRNKVTQ